MTVFCSGTVAATEHVDKGGKTGRRETKQQRKGEADGMLESRAGDGFMEDPPRLDLHLGLWLTDT